VQEVMPVPSRSSRSAAVYHEYLVTERRCYSATTT
jgi:hypothetical protein